MISWYIRQYQTNPYLELPRQRPSEAKMGFNSTGHDAAILPGDTHRSSEPQRSKKCKNISFLNTIYKLTGSKKQLNLRFS